MDNPLAASNRTLADLRDAAVSASRDAYCDALDTAWTQGLSCQQVHDAWRYAQSRGEGCAFDFMGHRFGWRHGAPGGRNPSAAARCYEVLGALEVAAARNDVDRYSAWLDHAKGLGIADDLIVESYKAGTATRGASFDVTGLPRTR